MHKEILERFNNKFNKIKNHNLIRWIEQSSYRNGSYTNFENCIPENLNRNDLDAYLFHFRLFLLKKDNISIDDIFLYYDNLEPHYREFSIHMNDIKNILDSFLNKQSLHAKYNYKELFDLCMYGGFAHENPNKTDNFNKLFNQSGAIGKILFCEFLNVIYKYYEIMRIIESTNNDFLNTINQ